MPNEFKVKNGLIVDQGGAYISGSSSITGSFSASLQSGHTFVGDANGISRAVPTSSFSAALPAGVVSGSSQIDITQTTGYTSFSSSTATVDNAQNVRLNTIESFTSSVAGTNTFTASIAGTNLFTASIAGTNTFTASIAGTNLFTASVAGTNTFTASVNNSLTQLNSRTGSYATTGSNTFQGNQTINGTLNVTNIVVTTITASTEFASGSTRFGSNNSNTHEFTGSVSITGSLNLPYLSAGSIAFVGNNGVVSQNNSNLFWDNTNTFLGVGTNSYTDTIARMLVVSEGLRNPIEQRSYSNTVGGGTLYKRARGTFASPATVNNTDFIGAFEFSGHNGTNFQPAGLFALQIDGVPSSTSMPGRFSWHTTPSGSNTYTEKMRLTNGGNLLIQNGGTFTDGGERLQVSGSARITNGLSVTGSVTATSFAGTINANNGVVSGSSQIDITQTTGYTSFSSSTATIDNAQTLRLNTIESFTSSVAGTNTFTSSIAATNTFTASANLRLNSLESFTSSVAATNTFTASIAGTNAFTQSANLRLNSLETTSASVISRVGSIETFTSSFSASNFQTDVTQSVRLNSIETFTASVAGTNTFTASVAGTNLFTQSANLRLNSLEASSASDASRIASIESFTSSFSSSNFQINVTQSARLNTIETFTSSIAATNTFTASIAGTNTFTQSANLRLNALETTSASVVSRVGSIETFTASIAGTNTFTASLNNSLTQLNSRTGSYATTGSNTFQGNQTINGTLNVTNIVVTTITASTQYSSGSTRFGSSSENTHEFTGSVRITGSTTITGGNLTLEGTSLLNWTGADGLYVDRTQIYRNYFGNTFGRIQFNGGITAYNDVRVALVLSAFDSNNNAIHIIRNATSTANNIYIGNNTAANATLSASFHVDTPGQGVLLPRMSSAQRTGSILVPPQGIIVYDTGSMVEGFYYYSSGSIKSWTRLLNDTGSQIISGSIETTGGITGSILANNGVVSGSSQVTLTSTTGYTAFSQSLAGTDTSQSVRLNSLEGFTASVAGTNIFTASIARTNTFTASVAATNTFTASIASTNTFTQSVNLRLNALETSSASAVSRIASIESFTSSVAATNTFTASIAATNVFTASIAGTNTFTSSIAATNVFTSSIAGTNVFTASIAGTNAFTQSSNLRLNALETTSASVVSRVGSIESFTSSFSSSNFQINVTQSARLNAVETFTSSVATTNTFTQSANLRLNSIETFTSSVAATNTFTASANNSLTQLNLRTGSYATTGSNTFIGNETISGSLIVTGSTILSGSSIITGSLVIVTNQLATQRAFAISSTAPSGSQGYNIFIGTPPTTLISSGSNGGAFNTVVGVSSLNTLTTGVANTAIGYAVGGGITSGSENTMIGGSNLAVAQTAVGDGKKNVAVGYRALIASADGNNNTAVGYDSLGGLINLSGATGPKGNDNVGIGFSAGRYYGGSSSNNNSFSTGSIFIGANSSPSTFNSTNEIVIGTDTIGNGNNSITLGNTNITKTILRSGVGIGVAVPTTALHVVGQLRLASYTTTTSYTGTSVGVLAFDSSGNILTIATPGGSSGTPGGSNTEIQYNNGGAFGGVPTLTYDGTTLRATGSFTGSFTGTILSNNGVVSGSSQVDITQTTGYTTFSQSLATTDTTQTLQITSLNTFTASVAGTNVFTASVAGTNAFTASVAGTNLFTASIAATNTFTASANNSLTQLNLRTGSYATTGSNTFIGNQNISGSVSVTGSIKIQGSGTTLLHVTGSGGDLFSIVDSGSNFPIIATFSSASVNVLTVTTSSVVVSGSLLISASMTSSGDIRVYGHTVGRGAGFRVENTVLGFEALGRNTTATRNTAMGWYALSGSTNNGSNTAVGAVTQRFNTGGSSNSSLGEASLFSLTVGSFNTAMGQSALGSITDGTNNVGVGYYAGDTLGDGATPNTTSDNSVYIGYLAFASQSNGQNEIVIGANNTGNGSNSVTLGNSSITKTILRSGVGIGTLFPSTALHVVGQLRLASYTTTTSYAGTAAGVLAFDSSGNILTIATPGGGSGTPGGSNTQIQYNNGGAFAGVPVLTYDGTTLRVTGSILANNGIVSGSSQIDITQTTGYTTFSQSLATTDTTQTSQIVSLNTFTASVARTNTFTASANLELIAIENFTASIAGTNAFTASTNLRLNSIQSFTASANLELIALENYTASLNLRTGSFATTASNTFQGNQSIVGAVSASSFTGSGASLTGVVTQIIAGTNITISPTSGTGSVTINASGGGGISDGDKGDITVSSAGTVWTIDNSVVTVAKISATGTPSATTFLRGDGSWSTPSGGGGGGTGTIMLTAAGGWPSLTNGCQPPQSAQTATNLVNFYYLGFLDGATTTNANWAIPMPADYNGGTITAQFYWTANNASTAPVVWGLQARAYPDNSALEAAFGTAQEVADANQGTRFVNISAATSAITIGGTPAAGNFVQFRAYRIPSAAGDTLAATAELLSIRITYTKA